MKITAGKLVRYAVLPEIIPRIAAFFASGFSHIALYLAFVYGSVRLLPKGHVYLNPANIGRFGIRNVIFEARRNLVFSRENSDQVIMFFTVLIGIVLLFLQFAILLASILMPVAAATSLGDEIGDYMDWSNFFIISDENTRYDIAYRLLDLTFGFSDPYPIFNSCVIRGEQCQLAFEPGAGYTPVSNPHPLSGQFHTGLHSLFHFYNIGILAVGFMILMYMVVTIIGETAQSGTPFGRRFNGMWAPVRLIFAIALLTPLSFGMNSAQLVTLHIAKWGSNLATNGWSEFMYDINERGTTILGDTDTLVARANAPPLNSIIEFLFTALTCKYSEELLNLRNGTDHPEVDFYIVYGQESQVFAPISFWDALAATNNDDIVLRIGPKDDEEYARYTGHVKPLCGELTFQTRDVNEDSGAFSMQLSYWLALKVMYQLPELNDNARNIALRYMPVDGRDPNAPIPRNQEIIDFQNEWNGLVPGWIDLARQAQVDAEWNEDHTVLGWAGAAIWYQKIAEYTGSLFASINGLPTPNLYPEIMEHVKDQRRIQNDFVMGVDRFNPVLSNGNTVEFKSENDKYMALAYYYAQSLWASNYTHTESNSFTDSIIAIFGLGGLMDIHKNLDIHPLAQLVGIGRSLVESAVTNLGFSFGAGVVGGIANILGQGLVESVSLAAASFAGQVALIGLSIGFILYYILPFLPFIYFFFAVGGWVKGIFEAMVGLPLWALAHVRIDGEGLPGPVAMNGYFLIFDIFIRPLLIIFGLLSGIIIFSAQVQVLNEIWPLVTSNILGFDNNDMGKTVTQGMDAMPGTTASTATIGSIEYVRTAADRLFYTVIYAIIVYMMGMSSFKLVDLIPNNILRWMNASVATFAEQAGDPAANLVSYSFMGSQMALGSLSSGMQGLAARSTAAMKSI